MSRIKIGVLRGGPSSEYEVSLKTGEAVLKHLDRQKYEPIDVLIDKTGVWHLGGLKSEPHQVFKNIDAAFNAMHGEYGEDGKVQQLMETYKIPYTGSDILSSATAMHKRLAKDIFEISGILTPPAVSVSADDDPAARAAGAVRKMLFPMVVKPASRGSSIGVAVANDIYNLVLAIEKALGHDKEVLVEKFISGREATCAVLENFRNQKHYAFPVVEIVPPPYKKIFDYDCKYDGSSREICPGRFSEAESMKIKNAAVVAHASLGCRHYSRSDFRIDEKGQVYLLELNTLPGLTAESLYPKAASAIGLEFSGLLDHLVTLALK
ncbi:MAG: D-alanine--D-alanine ligase [Patescibacteria group bacterium]